jgi:hypothetical protein
MNDAQPGPYDMAYPCIGVWEGVVMDSLEFHPSPPCLTLLWPLLGRLGRLLPFWTPHAVGLCIQGLPKVMLGPSRPYHSMPCRRLPLKRPYSHFRSCCPQSRQPAAVFLPTLIPHAIRAYIQPFSDNTHAALHSYDPIYFPFGQSQPIICE